MIMIADFPFDLSSLKNEYPNQSVESYILTQLQQLNEPIHFASEEALKFELQLRSAMVDSAVKLSKSRLGFATFRKSKCNPRYWRRLKNGGFQSLPNVKSSAAILDIYQNGRLYATECATAMVIVLYHALLTTFHEAAFNQLFPTIYLMNWHDLDDKIADIGYLRPTTYYLPGDRRYFYNPDVAPDKPEWQGENSIQLPYDKHYAHDFGVVTAHEIISFLNDSRRRNATKPAFLRSAVARPDFYYLYQLKNRIQANYA